MAKSIQKCEYCGFCTKNVYIFKRHKLRCRKDHGIGRGKKVPTDQAEEGQMATQPGPSIDNEDTVELGPENSAQETSAVAREEPEIDAGSQTKKEKPAVNRNYTCTKCEFKTNKSRAYLYHMIEVHKSKFDIYACSICEYCTQYRHKVQRHAKFAHKRVLEYDEIQTEYVSSDKTKGGPVKLVQPKPKKSLMSKGMPARKLMVKFKKKESGENVKKQLKAPILNMKSSTSLKSPSPTKAAPPGQLSKVVEEAVDENGEVIFKCKECQFISDDKQKVAKHAVSWHIDTISFSCPNCEYVTFERNDFFIHKLKHRNEHRYKCEDCTYSSNFKPNYERHRQYHAAGLPHKCTICSFSSATEASVKRHISTNHDIPPTEDETKELPEPQSQSSTVKSTDDEDSNSMSNKTMDEISPCDSPTSKTSPYGVTGSSLLFNINFDSSSASMVPRRTLPPPNMESMKLLMKELSPMRKLPPNITKYVSHENGKLVCPACKLKYKRSSDLNRHMKRKHGCKLREYLESDQALPPLSLTDDTDDSMIDGYGGDLMNIEDDDIDTGDDFVDQGDIGDDEFVSNGDQVENPMDLSGKSDESSPSISPEDLQCKYCTFKAKWPSDLRRHMAVHSIEKRFKCTYCPRKYKYIGDMNVHIRREHNKEPGDVKVVKVATIPRKKSSPALFKCPCCHYTSAWKSEIDRHTRTHTGDKTFQCRHCTYQTFWRGDIRRHVYKHHPELMTEGVAIDDVINIMKKTPEKALPENEGGGISLKGDAGTKESTPEAMDVDTMPAPGLPAQGENPLSTVQSMYGATAESGQIKPKSPTPSPVKDLGGGMYQCEHCGFTANAPSKMNSHMATHTNIKRYMCPLCGKRANWKWDISKHIRKDHNDQVTQVVKLSRQAAEDTIQEYMETNIVVKRDHHLNKIPKTGDEWGTYYKCSKCDYSEEQRISVARHINFRHTNQVSPAQIIHVKALKRKQNSPEKTLNKSQETTDVNKLHESPFGKQLYDATPPQTNSPAKFSKLAETSGSPDAGKPFMCSECGKKGATKGDIKKHYHYLHADKEIRIIYLGDGSQSVYTPKSEMPQSRLFESLSQGTGVVLSPDSPNKQLSGVSPNKGLTRLPTVEPKALGYIRPFQCGYCGRRSNWKWDVTKHIKDRHPGKEMRVITLSEQEARSTVEEYVQQQVPKLNKISGSVPRVRKGKSPSPAKEGSPSMLLDRSFEEYMATEGPLEPTDHYTGINMSDKVISDSSSGMNLTETDVGNTGINLAGAARNVSNTSSNISGAPTTVYNTGIDMAGTGTNVYNAGTNSPGTLTDVTNWGFNLSDIETNVSNMPTKGVHRQFKCSKCAYRSNWRTDVQRHIRRIHGEDGAGSYVIMLKEDVAEATLEAYNYKRGHDKGRVEEDIPTDGHMMDANSFSNLSGPLPRKAWAGLEKKLWKCSMCPYSDEDKVDVLKHLGKHNMKAYKCTQCNWSANFRSGVYRHIQNKHPGDKSALCRLAIKLIKEGPGNDVLGQAIIPGQPPSQASSVLPTMTLNQPSIENFMRMPDAPAAAAPVGDGDNVNKTRKVVYHCKLCPEFRSKWRSCVCRHLRQTHDNREYMTNCIKKIIKVAASQSDTDVMPYMPSPVKPAPTTGHTKPARSKNFACALCPYRSYKAKMLRFHERCHTPQPGVKQFKCKHCPYYVNRNRLLTQHSILHLKTYKPQKETTLQSSPTKGGRSSDSQSPAGPKRHRCEKCPYTTNSKNDFIYHKQFHRPKPTADFKCDYCEYWVTHRRLLKQHMKVHGEMAEIMFSQQETPTKSEQSENAYVYDTVEIAEIKQRIIASKITPSISQSPIVSPMKIAAGCSMGGKRGFLRKDGTYRKIHRCHHCPYMNVRLRNMRLHELMHGKRTTNHVLIKCPHCDYHVGSKGLLAHHLKVHQPNYDMVMLGLENEQGDSLASEDCEPDTSITVDNKVDGLLEIARYKKYGCEKCPYASAKKNRFQKHVELHGSKQKCKCDYCDYSVPSANLLQQHLRLHFEPNQNLLAAQSIQNLQYLPEMPADVALASMMTNNDSKNPVSITHDHIDLFENAPEDAEPKKIYRCDRCPYANVRRDNLLAHLRCHMTKNEFVCPYCDYSVGKTHVLVQHVKVHFSPLPELSDWLTENGDAQRMKEVKEKNITEVLEVMKMLQTDKQKGNGKDTVKSELTDTADKKDDAIPEQKDGKNKDKEKEAAEQINEKGKAERTETDMEVDDNGNVSKDGVAEVKGKDGDKQNKMVEDEAEVDQSKQSGSDATTAKNVVHVNGTNGVNLESYVCQYCDRDFSTSDLLVQHEMQHLIGNSYEDMVSQLLEAASVIEKREKASSGDNESLAKDGQATNDASSDGQGTSEAGSEGVFIVNEKGEKIGEMTPVKQRKRHQDGTFKPSNEEAVVKLKMRNQDGSFKGGTWYKQ